MRMQDFRLHRGFVDHQAQFIVLCLGVAVAVALPLVTMLFFGAKAWLIHSVRSVL
jgi:hypothetical protein